MSQTQQEYEALRATIREHKRELLRLLDAPDPAAGIGAVRDLAQGR